jgi:hypothetical protein
VVALVAENQDPLGLKVLPGISNALRSVVLLCHSQNHFTLDYLSVDLAKELVYAPLTAEVVVKDRGAPPGVQVEEEILSKLTISFEPGHCRHALIIEASLLVLVFAASKPTRLGSHQSHRKR